MIGKRIGFFVCLIVAVFLVACQTNVDSGGSTEIIAFIPTVPDLTKTGECGSHSRIIGRGDARRCQVGHHIFDPCVMSGGKLVCGAIPWAHAKSGKTPDKESFVVVAGPPPIDAPQTDPGGVIAMELDDGARCLAVGGNMIEFDGKSVNYRCDVGQATERVVLGHPRKGKVWVADYAKLGHNANGYFIHERAFVSVKRVWR